jgi:hypothetical protein
MLRNFDQRKFIYVLSISIFTLGFIWLINSYTPIANDDTFIYYNYAHNMVEGRFFAHDVRNMPTEGFTSILYLLLLTPFELLNINLMIGSFIINFIALVLLCGVIYCLFRFNDLLPASSALLGTSLVWLLVIMDVSMKTSFNLGLETILGCLMALTVIAIFAKAYSEPEHPHAINLFFVLLFGAYLVRPETIAFLGAFAIPLLLLKPANRKRCIRNLLIFGVIFAGYHGLKYLIFGDILPTSFYRKVNSSLTGPSYVAIWIKDYFDMIQLLLVMLAIYLILPNRQLFKQSWFWFAIWMIFISIFFFGVTTPLAGGGHRFFATSIIIFYILLVGVGLLFLEKLPAKIKPFYPAVVGSLALIFVGISFLRLETPLSLNIYQKAEKTVDDFIYLRLGNHLRQSLSDPDDVTLVFGDAGALPYALGGTFIDSNGLTEPYIARMFSRPDDAQKVADYVDYILSFEPDIVVLAWGAVSDDGVWVTNVNYHSPFRILTPIELYQAYYDANIRYSCSLRDLFHIGLRTDSVHYDELNAALSTFCHEDENGYIVEEGLTISSPDGDSVHFLTQ